MTWTDPDILVRDYESRSTVDLTEVGAHIYAAHPTTEIMYASYCYNDGPVKLWRPGMPTPPEFIEAYKKKKLFGAFNAAFEMQIEQNILGPKFGWPVPPLELNRCAMAICNALALPGSLGGAAKAANLEYQKDVVGERLMKQMMKPRRARKSKKEDPTQVYWFEDEERMDRLGNYCGQDTEVERELLARLPWLSDDEQAIWEMDQRINDRGFYIDKEMAEAACAIVATAQPQINEEIAKLTDDEVTAFTQVAKIKEWLKPYCGVVVSLNKDAIEEFREDRLLPENVKRVIELRGLGAQAASSKMEAMLQRRCHDGRLRGAFVYHAAGPGRWSSRGAQVHNLKRNPFEDEKDLLAAIEMIMTRSYARMRKKYPNPLSIIGDCIRATIIAPPKKKLVGADFSNIEGRVTAWLADEESKLEVFRKYDRGEGPDPYIATAAKILKKKPELVTKVERQKIGKPAELGFGYQGGYNAFMKFAPDTEFTKDEIESFKFGWRKSHQNIERFWGAINRAAIYAVRHPGDLVQCGRILLECDDQPMLWVTLPSGRKLSYPNARFCKSLQLPDGPLLVDHQKGSLGVVFKDNSSGQWRDVRGYGGFWTENLVQAIARDLLALAMVRLEHAGFDIVLHVHDEAVIEISEKRITKTLIKKFESIMAEVPDWGIGIPVIAKAWVDSRYVK